MAQTMRTCRPGKAAFGARTTHRVCRSINRSVRVCAAAPQTAPAAAQTDKQARQVAAAGCLALADPRASQTYYALVANAEFFVNDVQNESLAEQLRERVRFLKEKDQPADFYFVPNPVWLDAKFPTEAKMVKRPCMALVSTDKMWTIFMKLRLDRVLKLDLAALTEEEVLQMGEALPEFTFSGKWTAPYSAYSPGWWEVFYPKQ